MLYHIKDEDRVRPSLSSLSLRGFNFPTEIIIRVSRKGNRNGTSTCPGENTTMVNRVILICLTALVLCIVCSPAIAHSAAEMGISLDHYDLGIPVYWPFHAFLMSTGFVLLLSGLVVMRSHKTSNWYRSHMILQSMGGIFAIGGIVISFFMVSLSGVPHLRYTHGILGVSTIILIAGMLLLGYQIYKNPTTQAKIRTTHRWVGLTSIALVAVNILLGLSMMTTVLAQ